jgi:hypothetical protein
MSRFILDYGETKALGFGTHMHAKIFRRANPLALAEGAEDLGVDVFLRRVSVTSPVQTVDR